MAVTSQVSRVSTAQAGITRPTCAHAPGWKTAPLNFVWTLLAAFLVMFMQAGFALVATGLCRAKSAAHTMSMNFMIYALGVLGFWFCGFAFMFGGSGVAAAAFDAHPTLGASIAHLDAEWTVRLGGHAWGVLGHRGFLFSPKTLGAGVACLFVFQSVFMSITATVPTGAMAERWNFKNFMLYGFWVGMIGYAVFGNWVWGGGWLSQLGAFAGLGHGHVDFAGSSVAHMTGGIIGAVGASVLGPRLGKFKPDGTARAIPGHNLPYVILGTFILAFGWFGFNPGSTMAGTDEHIAAVALNTMLASAAGACFAALGMYFRFGKPDPSVMCNGMLAGLVAITASCGFVSSAGAVIIGAVAGLAGDLGAVLRGARAAHRRSRRGGGGAWHQRPVGRHRPGIDGRRQLRPGLERRAQTFQGRPIADGGQRRHGGGSRAVCGRRRRPAGSTRG